MTPVGPNPGGKCMCGHTRGSVSGFRLAPRSIILGKGEPTANLTVDRKRRKKMRVLKLLFIVLLCSVSISGQNLPVRIALSPRSTVPMSVVARGMDKKCSGIILTTDASKADYLLEASETVDMRNGTDYVV